MKKVNGLVEAAIADYSVAHPEKIAPKLAEGWKETEALIQQVKASQLSDEEKYNITFELEIKKTQFNNALAQSLGLSVAANVAPEKEPDPRFAMFMGDPETTRVIIPGAESWGEGSRREPEPGSGQAGRNQDPGYRWQRLGNQKHGRHSWRPYPEANRLMLALI